MPFPQGSPRGTVICPPAHRAIPAAWPGPRWLPIADTVTGGGSGWWRGEGVLRETEVRRSPVAGMEVGLCGNPAPPDQELAPKGGASIPPGTSQGPLKTVDADTDTQAPDSPFPARTEENGT